MALVSREPTYLGTVQDVQGATVSVTIEPELRSGLAFVDGHGYRIGQIGSFVRVPIGYIDLFGIVSQVGAGAVPERLAGTDQAGRRWMTIQLIGEGQASAGFERGVSQYPTVGDAVHLVTEQDLTHIYGRPESPNFIPVGHLASAESIPALLNVDKLLTRHCAVVGTTGAGKSTTVSTLLNALADGDRYPSARILVLDIHGEYAAALRDRAAVFRVSPDPKRGDLPLVIPYWAMSFDELLGVTFGGIDDSRGSLIEKIVSLKRKAMSDWPREGVTGRSLTVDSPVPFSIHKLWFDLYRIVNSTHTVAGGQSDATEALELDETGQPVERGDAMNVVPPRYRPHTQAAGAEKIFLSQPPEASLLKLRRPLEGLASKLRDPRFDFLFRPGPWLPRETGETEKDLDELLEAWIGGPRPVTFLDLSGIPASILTDLIGTLLRILFDAIFWARNMSEGGRERPLLIVLEEAHTYIGQGDKGAAATAVRRIAKEGRKYGIGAMVVSQRPAEIDATVLSQCGTIFAMRLANSTDRAHVSGAVADNLEGLLGMLPVLRTGEAIVVGEAVHLPLRTVVDLPGHSRRPDSRDPLVYVPEGADYMPEGPGGWNRSRENGDYAEVLKAWRAHNPNAAREINSEEEE